MVQKPVERFKHSCEIDINTKVLFFSLPANKNIYQYVYTHIGCIPLYL